MAKDKNSGKSPKKDDEYQFKEEYVEPEQVEKPRRQWRRYVLNRRVIVIAGIVLAIFLLYQFLEPRSRQELKQAATATGPLQPVPPATTPSTTTLTATTTPSLTPVTTLPQMPTATAPIAPTQPQTTLQQPALQQLSQQTLQQQQPTTVIQQTQQNTADIRAMRSGIQQLQGQVTQVNNQLSTISNSINTLTTKTAACKAVITPPPAKVTAVKTMKTQVVVFPRRCYFVRAVLPGRAWLYATDGHLTTVKIGDYLRGYGTIQLINAREGKVYTSGGDVIRYGVNDS